MLRAKLPQRLSEGRRAQRRAPARRAGDQLAAERPQERSREAAQGDAPRRTAEHRDVQRARTAGGPVDRASYACACGYIFQAAVSTGVTCPHCGADQAW